MMQTHLIFVGSALYLKWGLCCYEMETKISEQIQPVKVIASPTSEDKSEKSLDSELKIRSWDKRERTVRALKTWGILWAVMVPAIFIPVLHFLLVPLLFFGGPLAAIYLYRQENQIQKGELPCPACNNPIQISSGPVSWPLHTRCGSCQRFIRLERSISQN